MEQKIKAAWAWAGANRITIDLDRVRTPTPSLERGAGDRESDNLALKLDLAPWQANRAQIFVYGNDSGVEDIDTGPMRAPETSWFP